jgi:hypothetical protein
MGDHGLRAEGGDGPEVRGGEPQVLTDERARDSALPGFATQPRFLDRQQHRGLGRGVQDDVVLSRRYTGYGRLLALLTGGS